MKQLVEYIKSYKGRPVTIMEVCGTHTMSIARLGIKSLLPETIRIISGPGCPVCVTAQTYVDKALELARMENVTIATFGDLMRVPGKRGTLAQAKAEGADIRVVQSPMESFGLNNPREEIVFLSVGFETTTPTIALSLIEAREKQLKNFSVLVANKTMPKVMEALMASGDAKVDGFIYPGHVVSVDGLGFYRAFSKKHGSPGVVAGFQPLELLVGICKLLQLLEARSCQVENVYRTIVKEDGNPVARELVERVFRPGDAVWRGFGLIPGSGLVLRDEYKKWDAEKRFRLSNDKSLENPACRCGEILKGKMTPSQCRLFGTGCTPAKPVGACMVSSEGACAAEYRYGGLYGE